ncbi:hypothetical protein G5C65_34755 [Streptomyces sp. SB3404]|uniref:Secreted protein n=1 Tax=Streptomyces boncukensis TaxID=2711219 RepID=A0A6G4X9H7_9ACTN|nr:hypothetical protein [Streptomyces boncukensis]
MLSALPLALAAAGTGAGTAQAADKASYRYWSLWERNDGAWTYGDKGPSVLRPGDGDVVGFRFAVTEDSGDAAQPRGKPGFEAACAGTEPKSGSKRIALRIDFGTGRDAPQGETPPEPRTACARIDAKGSAADALAAVAKPLRYNSDALLCAIDGYPAKGCAEQVSGNGESSRDGSGNQDRDQDDGAGDGDGGMSSGIGVAAGLAAVAVLGVAALWQARRRRQ